MPEHDRRILGYAILRHYPKHICFLLFKTVAGRTCTAILHLSDSEADLLHLRLNCSARISVIIRDTDDCGCCLYCDLLLAEDCFATEPYDQIRFFSPPERVLAYGSFLTTRSDSPDYCFAATHFPIGSGGCRYTCPCRCLRDKVRWLRNVNLNTIKIPKWVGDRHEQIDERYDSD